MKRSVQPVLHLQTGDSIEVHAVSSQHGGIVFEGDAGDAPPRSFKPAGARTGKPSGFKPGPPGKLHRKGPPKPRE